MADVGLEELDQAIDRMQNPRDGFLRVRQLVADPGSFVGSRFSADVIPDAKGGHRGPGYRGRIAQSTDEDALVLTSSRPNPPPLTEQAEDEIAHTVGEWIVGD